MDNTNGNYFKVNPEKVIGKLHTHNPNTGKLLTDQYGRPKPVVYGSIEDVVKGISTPDVDRFDHFRPSTGRTKVVNNPKSQESRVKKALELSTKPAEQPKAGEYDLKSLYQSIIEYNQNVEYLDVNGERQTYDISKDEIEAYVTYQVQTGLYQLETIQDNAWGAFYREDAPWDAWLDADLVAYDGSQYVPSSIFYSGNMYDRLEEVQSAKDSIVAKIGKEGYDRQLALLDQGTPKRLKITNDTSEKLYLSPFDKIWDDVEINMLADGREIESRYEGFKMGIGTIFYSYFLTDLPESDLQHEGKRARAYDIYQYWIEKARFPNGTGAQEKAAIRRNTSLLGTMLFDRFLIEMLSEEDKNKIERLWNRKRNGFKPFDYHRIPVAFSINKKFKGGELRVRPAQREGVSFMNSRGTGIIAYDVGVGKTMTAILGIEDGFSKGVFKRPMIVVPQKVYHKWIAEIRGVYAEKDIYRKVNGKKKLAHKKGDLLTEGILPHRQVNDFYNLGTDYLHKVTDKNGVAFTVPEFSITMITYEGLVKIGFNEQTEGALSKRLKEALSQGESGREAAILEEKAVEWIDKSLAKTEIDIEEIGLDMILVDEAHNFRNLFMDVKGDVGKDGEREQKNFYSSSGSKPSNRSLSLFMLNAYIQDKNKRRNTFGLTATPFTNRATEVYSMLSLYDYEGMKDFDVYNIAQFCETFIDETYEDVWTAKGTFDISAVIRGYNNLPTMQSMIFRAIIYKTGVQANISRPEKIILPLLKDENGIPLDLEHIADTKLVPTERQEHWLKEIEQFAQNKGGTKFETHYPRDEKGNIPGQVLIALNASRAVTFSPFAISLAGEKQHSQTQVTAEQFVDGSPKIKYAVECIRTVKKYHDKQNEPVSGQVIYSDRGKEWFGHIKEYLVNNVGFLPEEVEVFHGGVTPKKREKLKEEFLSNKIKVLIGTSTMREGVDLQKHGSVIYVCYIDWNPTDVHQLFGRIWRFGNKFSHVRIVVPLIENSSDIFTWQKLSEKMSRLNTIWAKANDTKLFEESDLNAEELKKGLINDPEKLAQYDVEEAVGKLDSELRVVVHQLGELEEAANMKESYNRLLEEIKELSIEATTNPKRLTWNVKEDMVEKLKNMEITDLKSRYRIVKAYGRLKTPWDKREYYSLVDQHIKYSNRINTIEKNILKPYDLTIFDNFQPIVEKLKTRKEKLDEQIAEEKSEEKLASLVENYRTEMAKKAQNAKTIDQRVNEFQRLNYLLDCKFGHHNCDIYGRIHEIKTDKVIAVKKQEKVKVETTAFTYRMPEILKKVMPGHQQKFIKELLADHEDPKAYVKDVLNPLHKQVKALPKVYSTQETDNKDKVLLAHYFAPSHDYYIVEIDKQADQFYGFTILQGDWINAEWGYIGIRQLTGTPLIQMDFNWRPIAWKDLEGNPAAKKPDPKPKASKDEMGKKINKAISGLKILKAIRNDDPQMGRKIAKALTGLETLKKLTT
jgi:superfamily II DNA/RNA helicase